MGHQISHSKINFVLLSALVWNWIIVQLQYSFWGIFPNSRQRKVKKKLLGKLNQEGPVVQKVDNAIHRIN